MPLKDDWVSGEQWTADDANDVAEAVNAAYVKPGDGIPKADLVAAVQVSLGKADTAVQAVDAATISDSTSTGRAVLKAADAAAARAAIGVAYGTTSGTVVQGNDSRLTPNAAAITDSTATGRAVLTAADASTARSVLGVAYGTTSGTVVQGNDSRLTGVVRRTVLNPTVNLTLGSDSDHVVFANIPTVPESGEPNYNSTIALLAGDGSNNSTTITDSSYLAGAWTANGNAKLATGTKKYGSASISFDGTNSYLTTSGNASFGFGVGDFCIEFWFYNTDPNPGASFKSIYDGRDTTSSVAPRIWLQYGYLRYDVGNTNRISGPHILNSSWKHIAVARSSGVTKLFVDGVQQGSSYTDSNNYVAPTALKVGCYLDGVYDFLHGFIDDFRVTKGAARYTSNFTPPASAHPTSQYATAVTPKITLPTAVGNVNMYTIHNVHATALALQTTSSQTIPSTSLTTGQKLTVVSNGSNWVAPW